VNPGDVIIIESPSYLGALNAFKACQPKFVEIPTDDDGMIMEDLEKVLATTENVKMIYVIPDFQNPTGRTWPIERRKQFMEIINKYEVPVIEDNPYGELRYSGEYLPALKSMDTKGLVVYLGTFSKILAPGYRLGWVCADDAILQKYNFMAQAAALQASTIGMMEVSKFIDMFDLDEHVATIRECYGHRNQLMQDTMAAAFPKEVKYTHPQGGLFAWVQLPEYIDTKVMAAQALEKKVAYVPGEGFLPQRRRAQLHPPELLQHAGREDRQGHHHSGRRHQGQHEITPSRSSPAKPRNPMGTYIAFCTDMISHRTGKSSFLRLRACRYAHAAAEQRPEDQVREGRGGVHVPEKGHGEVLQQCARPYLRKLGQRLPPMYDIEEHGRRKAHGGAHHGHGAGLAHDAAEVRIVQLRGSQRFAAKPRPAGCPRGLKTRTPARPYTHISFSAPANTAPVRLEKPPGVRFTPSFTATL
jgi:histidinol-phosphate/aromatic aminotransferase/cobyric acid decarboxylase-like protein